MKKITFLALLLVVAHCCVREAAGQQLRDLYGRVDPSVVVIRTVEKDVAPDRGSGLVSMRGLGSGVLISEDGKILTAAHVVQAADRVTVEFAGGKRVRARVTASYPRADVAMLQADAVPQGATPARLGDSDRMRVGDEVFVIGAPYGLSHSLSVGHVSGKHVLREMIAGLTNVELFQTDSAINEGNSGGPVFNMDGEVVGVVSQILSRSGGFEGLGFAVTSNVARRLLFNDRSFWAGVDGYLLTGELAGLFNLPQPAGLLVMRAAENSPASDLGLRAGAVRALIGEEELIVGGDIILEVAGVPLAEDWGTLAEMQAALVKLRPGDKYSVKVLRGGRVIELTAGLRAR
jgi:serine protease Do